MHVIIYVIIRRWLEVHQVAPNRKPSIVRGSNNYRTGLRFMIILWGLSRNLGFSFLIVNLSWALSFLEVYTSILSVGWTLECMNLMRTYDSCRDRSSRAYLTIMMFLILRLPFVIFKLKTILIFLESRFDETVYKNEYCFFFFFMDNISFFSIVFSILRLLRKFIRSCLVSQSFLFMACCLWLHVECLNHACLKRVVHGCMLVPNPFYLFSCV